MSAIRGLKGDIKGLPRGIPAASLKRRSGEAGRSSRSWSSAGNTRGLIEATWSSRTSAGPPPSSAGNTRGLIEARGRPVLGCSGRGKSSAGNTRGLIEATAARPGRAGTAPSSAGNTRGLIEAAGTSGRLSIPAGLPRGIPAASLKRLCRRRDVDHDDAGLPRGIPAASLKLGRDPRSSCSDVESSAGNTRGLIEAR